MSSGGQITDYLTGKELKATPEEPNRQIMLRRLVEDYGYSKDLLKTEFGVKRSPSDTRRSLPVDIAVFDTPEDALTGKAKIFVETKKPTSSEGKDQLWDYMSLNQDVKYGVWFNGNVEDGSSIAFYKKAVEDKRITFIEVSDIPKCGFSEVSEQIKISELLPTNNLKVIFKTLRGFIAANATGTTRDETILSQLAILIITKLYDEIYSPSDSVATFRVHNNSSADTFNMVSQKFEEAKSRWSGVFDSADSITLSPSVLFHVVSQLQRYSLSESPRNAISEAFESIINYATKGSQGQFFTPSNVAELMVAVADPSETDFILDPASGTAGFLSASMFFVWDKIATKGLSPELTKGLKQEFAMQNLFGIEKDSFLAKIAKAFMIIMGDGKSGMFVEDSLDEASWSHLAKAKVAHEKFDIIITNPPFGKDVKLRPEIAKLYKYGNKIELAFMEQCINLLKPDGKLGIILPETIFHSPSNADVRKKLFYKHNITHLIDLPHDTFRPYNNAKCDIVFLQKNAKQQPQITCIKIDEIGHNHLGNEKYVLDDANMPTQMVADDIPEILKSVKNNSNFDKHIVKVDALKILSDDLLVARPYFTASSTTTLKTIGELISEGVITHFDGHGSPKSELKGLGEYPYIRVKDVVNLELAHNRLDDIPKSEYDRLASASKKLKEQDIVFVRRGSYRIGDVGILYKKDIDSILTREILVLRVTPNNKYGLTPFSLLGLLNSHEVRLQIANKVLMDTTLPNIQDRWKDLRVDVVNKLKLEELNLSVSKMYDLRSKFWDNYATIYGVNG